jgi:aspartate/methionine/tyrosine aminotransferase
VQCHKKTKNKKHNTIIQINQSRERERERQKDNSENMSTCNGNRTNASSFLTGNSGDPNNNTTITITTDTTTTTTTTRTSTTTRTTPAVVSSRGYRALKPPLPYLSAFFQALENPCHETENSKGYIALCVAENKLVLDALSRRLLRLLPVTVVNDDSDYKNHVLQPPQGQGHKESSCWNAAFANFENYCYNDMRGMMHARESVARFLTRKFLRRKVVIVGPNHHDHDTDDDHDEGSHDTSNGAGVIKGENVILGSGCAGLLNGLFFCLLEPGDVVLIPAPYYAAFESDMKVVAQCVPVKVSMANPSQGPTVEELEFARLQVEGIGVGGNRVKMLLLTNPNNPLGTIYSPETMKNAIDWARSHGMHTVVDEIYGLCIHNVPTDDDDDDDDDDNCDDDDGDDNCDDDDDCKFQSVIQILNNQLDNNVHFLWALSKDFGSSGFRVGVLYTLNKVLNNALSNFNVFSSVSQPMQSVVAELLQDDEFIDKFLDESSRLLRASYEIVVEALEEMDIPYVKAQAGMFVYCDFSSWLPMHTFEGEAMLGRFFQDQVRIVMTPGECQRDDKPGMFRICYAWVTPNVLRIAMDRLKLVALDMVQKGPRAVVVVMVEEEEEDAVVTTTAMTATTTVTTTDDGTSSCKRRTYY